MGGLNDLFAQVTEPSSGRALTQTVPNAFAIRKHFADMRIAMAMDGQRTPGHDWFENRAGGMENFNRLQQHVLDPNFAGNDQFPKDMVDGLRRTMSATNYNAAMVEAMVKSIVIKASIPTTSNIPAADRDALQAIINGAVTASPTPAAPLITPSEAPRSTPSSGPTVTPSASPSDAARGTPSRAPVAPN
ncbi:MAG: hypothetical protein SFW65_04435 [Alphaproteobacteria bacterium]|nr:hypothetical protein [Alphaproteobacteria bacterium]